MSTFTHPITLHSASGGSEAEWRVMVDTGPTFTVVPSPVLGRLGFTPDDAVRLRLANGQVEHRGITEIEANLNGTTRTIICVFGEPSAPPIIGAVTLELFLLGVDPVGQRLVPVDGLWM